MTVKKSHCCKYNIVSFADCCQQCPDAWAPLKSGGDHQCDLYVRLVWTIFLLLLLLQWATLFVMRCNLVGIAYHNHNTKVLNNAFVAMAVKEAQASLQALWHFIGMIRDCDWHNQFYPGRFGAFTIVMGHVLVDLCGKGLIVAMHDVCKPTAFVARGSSSPCTTYTTNYPCGKGLIAVPSTVVILSKRLLLPSLARGSLCSSSANTAS